MPPTSRGVVDWKAVKNKTQTRPWASAIESALARAFDTLVNTWRDQPPTLESGWTHHYYCDDDATRLTFDFKKPHEHICPKCRRVYTGQPWDNAWRTMIHGSIASNIERAAILARLRPAEKKYAQYVRSNVLFYAEHYADYAVHGRNAGKGKIMPQSLDEAIQIVTIGRALEFGQGQGWLDDAEQRLVAQRLFKASVELLQPQVKEIHNIHAWMLASIATSARQLDDQALLDWTINSPHGFKQQIERGCDDDGFWYEGSISYQYYTFNAFMSHAWAASWMGVDLFDSPKLQKMLMATLNLVYADGTFPTHNDGWPGVTLDPNFYEMGAWAWTKSSFATDLGWIYRLTGKAKDVAELACGPDQMSKPIEPQYRASVQALLLGPVDVDEDAPQPKRESRHFPASGIAILESKDDLRICLRAGPDGGSHDHRDKLNIDVFAKGKLIVPDLGTSGYGATITNKWYKTAASHCTIVIDGKRQNAGKGVIERFAEKEIFARADDVYPGVKMSRHIRLIESGWEDVVQVDCEKESQIDYFFHAAGKITADLQLEPATLGDGSGYAWLRDVRGATTDTPSTVTWATSAGKLTASLDASPRTLLVLSDGDTNPAGGDLGVLTIRRNTKQTRFVVRYQLV